MANMQRYSMFLEAEVREGLKSMAEANERTLAQEIRLALKNHIASGKRRRNKRPAAAPATT